MNLTTIGFTVLAILAFFVCFTMEAYINLTTAIGIMALFASIHMLWSEQFLTPKKSVK